MGKMVATDNIAPIVKDTTGVNDLHDALRFISECDFPEEKVKVKSKAEENYEDKVLFGEFEHPTIDLSNLL